MQVIVTMRHGHVMEETKERLARQAEKLTRIYDRLTSIELVVDLQDASHPKVDLLVSAEHKHDFVAHEQSDVLLTAVEKVVHKMERQIRKYKEKTIEQHRDPEAKRQAAEAVDTRGEDESDGDE